MTFRWMPEAVETALPPALNPPSLPRRRADFSSPPYVIGLIFRMLQLAKGVHRVP